MDYAADDALRRQHGRIRPESVFGSLVDRDGLAAGRISPDHARDDGFSNTELLQSGEGTDALGLEYGFSLLPKLHPELVIFALQSLILVVDSDEPNISAPNVADTVEAAIRKFFYRSEQIENPHSNETRIETVAAL